MEKKQTMITFVIFYLCFCYVLWHFTAEIMQKLLLFLAEITMGESRQKLKLNPFKIQQVTQNSALNMSAQLDLFLTAVAFLILRLRCIFEYIYDMSAIHLSVKI